MTDDMNDLDDLSQLWTSENSPEKSLEKNNVGKRIKFGHFKMIALVALEAIVAVAGIAAGLYKLAQGSIILGGSILIFSMASLVIVFWSRYGSWGVLTGSVKDELISSIKQTHVQYRWALGGIWISAFALIFLAVLLYSGGVTPDQTNTENHQFLLSCCIALVFIAMGLIITSLLLEKSRKRLFKLSILHSQLNAPDP